MEIKSNQVLFGNTKIQVDKEPIQIYTGYTDWKRTVTIFNSIDEPIMSFIINDIDSQVIATGLYMYYSDECFNPEFNPDPLFDPNFGGDIILDYDLLEVINPLVCQKYDINLLLEEYNGWGILEVKIPPTNMNLDWYKISMDGHNRNLNIRFSHVDKFGTVIQTIELHTFDVEQIYDLSQLINDDLDSLVTNFIQNNL